MMQSSANSLVLEWVTFSGRSLMKARNNRGPSTVPWGTPELTGACADDYPFRTTHWCLSARKWEIHIRLSLRTP